MTDKPLKMPDVFVKSLIPTLNNMGFMLKELDPYSELFIDYIGNTKGHALDMGCAYGMATNAALQRGARITACDMEPGHLEILEDRCPDEYKDRLTCVVGVMPGIDFPEESFDAILCSRVIHFFKEDDVRTCLTKMHSWLKPGAKLFMVADTPYSGPWKELSHEYEERKRNGHPWPGLIEDCVAVFPRPGYDASTLPEFLNFMDPDILTREFERIGFTVERASFADSDQDDPLNAGAGASHAGIVGKKSSQ